MSLAPGARLGPYEIVRPLGAGGMGEVYAARDSRLERLVALKLVLDAFVADVDRTLRFEREAKTLAALNHPNIATLHGLEQSDGRHFLVMELVEGETLAERIARHAGGLPVDDALRIACQIAEGLEAAHEKGIVHRDLKPANVKMTADDKVKVLDFGLARIAERDGAASSVAGSQSPTLTSPAMTSAGVILGTASYMSPEQARGSTADQRSDIFSFGVVLYEMLTGRQPFPGETMSDVLASVLARDPDLAAVPPDLSPRLRDLIRRCLDKNPKKRWQAIGDVRYELETLRANPRGAETAAPVTVVRSFGQRAFPFAAGALAAALVTAAGVWRAWPAASPPPVTRFVIEPTVQQSPLAGFTGGLDVSPDGRTIAFAYGRQVYVRSVGAFEPTVVFANPSRLSIRNVTFSPDARSLAFWTNDSWLRIGTDGGPPTTIAAAPATINGGASWSQGSLLFVTGRSIMRVAENGGTPEKLIDLADGTTPARPQLLPDGRTVLFTVFARSGADRFERGAAVVQRIGESERRTIAEPAADARFIEPGYLLVMRGASLLAAPFDPSAGATASSPVTVLDGVRRLGSTGLFAVSSSGTLAYVPGEADTEAGARRSFVLIDPSGAKPPELLRIPPGLHNAPRISPDGRHLAYMHDENGEDSIWVYDLGGSGAPRRLTFGGRDAFPVWSHDSQYITFGSERGGETAIYRQRADGSGAAERLVALEKGGRALPHAWSPDGRVLLFDSVKERVFTLMMLRADKTTAPFGDVSGSSPSGAVFSPDGRWVAYSKHVGNGNVVFVQPFPRTGALYQISKRSEDAHHPVWLAGGRELAYNPGPALPIQSVRVTSTPGFTVSEARAVAFNFINASPVAPRTYDAASNNRLVVVAPRAGAEEAIPSTIHVVVNWIEELKAKVRR